MKILHIWNNIYLPPKGGSGSQSHNVFLRDAFRQLGHKVVCLEPGVERRDGKPKQKTLRVQRTIYGWIKRLIPKWASDWVRDLYSLFYDYKYQKVIDQAKPNKPDTVQMTFRCPTGKAERFHRLAKTTGADRTRLLVGAVVALSDAMDNSGGDKAK